MAASGDDLGCARMLEFCHVFPARAQALEFAGLVDERDLEVCISWYEARGMWEAIVRRHMVPTHEEITFVERSLAERATSCGGEPDGWGCLQVDLEG